MTAKVLGAPLGIARAVGAFVRRRHWPAHGDDLPEDEQEKIALAAALPEPEAGRRCGRPQFLRGAGGILVFANWAPRHRPRDSSPRPRI